MMQTIFIYPNNRTGEAKYQKFMEKMEQVCFQQILEWKDAIVAIKKDGTVLGQFHLWSEKI